MPHKRVKKQQQRAYTPFFPAAAPETFLMPFLLTTGVIIQNKTEMVVHR